MTSLPPTDRFSCFSYLIQILKLNLGRYLFGQGKTHRAHLIALINFVLRHILAYIICSALGYNINYSCQSIADRTYYPKTPQLHNVQFSGLIYLRLVLLQ
jgi:hypothetical protein